MEYCPYCGEQIKKPSTNCPYCKKALDIGLIASQLFEGEGSRKNRATSKKIWLKEHLHIFITISAAIIGFIAGAVIFYFLAQVQFSNDRQVAQKKISELKSIIEQNKETAGSAREKLLFEVKQKDTIINILNQQKDLLYKIIIFTRRLTNNIELTGEI